MATDTLDPKRLARIQRQEERAAAQRLRRIDAEEHRTEARLSAALRREGRRAARLIRAQSTQLGLCYIRSTGRKAGTVAQIRFKEIVSTPSAHFLRVDTLRNPHRVNTTMFTQPEVLQDLSIAVGTEVTTFWQPQSGFWFQVQREGLASIPSLVQYGEILRQIPKTAGPLGVGLGLGANKQFYWADLSDGPHWLVAGQTDGGKSTMIHNIICTIIQRATPERAQLVLVDLKGKIELGVYRGIPHLFDFGEELGQRVYGKNEIVDVFRAVSREMERRMQLFERAGVRNLDRWNYKHVNSQRMPRVLVVIDEIANAMLIPSMRREIEPIISNIGAQSRASGIHLLISTQHPKREVITSLLDANIPGRLAFSTSTISASVVMLDNKSAYQIGPPGRMKFQCRGKHYVCQTPWVSEDMVDDIIEAVAQGRAAEGLLTAAEITRADIVRYCLETDDGHFVVDNVYREFFPQGMVYADIRRIQAELYSTGAPVTVDGRDYVLVGKSTRRWFEEVNHVDTAGEAAHPAVGGEPGRLDIPQHNGEGDV